MQTKLLYLGFVFIFLSFPGHGQSGTGVSDPSRQNSLRDSDNVDSIISDLKEFIPDFQKAERIPGVSVALVYDNEVAWTQGFGFANSITKKPVDTNSLFEIASVSKVVTAYIALRLVDEGRLSLTKPLHSYLSDEWMPYSAYRDSIKLNHVLSHSSGLRKAKREIMFEPGTAYHYSANGLTLLQDVIEEVTGETLEELAQRLVFQPLGMKNSSFVLKDELLPFAASGHLHATVMVALFGLLLLVNYLIIFLIGLVINRVVTKSWKLRRNHLIIIILLTIAVVTGVLLFVFGKSSLMEVAYVTLFTGFLCLVMFFIPYYPVRRVILKVMTGKGYQRLLSVLWASVIMVIMILVSLKIINVPVPSWPAYEARSAGTVRTSPGELALFMIEIANPGLLRPETAALLRTPQIKLDENLSWGMGPGIYYSDEGYALWQWGQNIDFQTIMIVFPESGFGVVVCTNSDLLNPDVALEIARVALGVDMETIRAAIHLEYDYSREETR
ncbi:class A beta-lactamase-related serine hydrolase [bacterium]|nr:class A beta-lactamase-related serine hydrolase [bacterium]